MKILGTLRRLLGIRAYDPNVPRALCRRRPGGARAPKRNGWHGPYAPPGLTPEEERALEAVELAQRAIRDHIAQDARRRPG